MCGSARCSTSGLGTPGAGAAASSAVAAKNTMENSLMRQGLASCVVVYALLFLIRDLSDHRPAGGVPRQWPQGIRASAALRTIVEMTAEDFMAVDCHDA